MTRLVERLARREPCSKIVKHLDRRVVVFLLGPRESRMPRLVRHDHSQHVEEFDQPPVQRWRTFQGTADIRHGSNKDVESLSVPHPLQADAVMEGLRSDLVLLLED